MPHVDTFFSSPFLKAGCLEGKDKTYTISGVEAAKVGQGDDVRPVVHFREIDKGLVLNKTNAKRICARYGKETEGWEGKTVTLYPSETEFGGETVECIRVRAGD